MRTSAQAPGSSREAARLLSNAALGRRAVETLEGTEAVRAALASVRGERPEAVLVGLVFGDRDGLVVVPVAEGDIPGGLALVSLAGGGDPAPTPSPSQQRDEQKAGSQAEGTEPRSLGAQFARVREDERRRIAEGIHDDPIQVLVALVWRLESLRRSALPAQQALIKDLERTTGAAIARLRRLIFELHPPQLHGKGFGAALRQQLERMSALFGLEYHLVDRMNTEPAPEVRITLYRIAREALVNVRKHARATRVHVLLTSWDGGFLVRVEDDGVGMPPGADAAETGHLGMTSMRGRAETAGGWWRVHSAPGGGTTVEFWLPEALDRSRSNGAGSES